jgi:hypothetical protein
VWAAFTLRDESTFFIERNAEQGRGLPIGKPVEVVEREAISPPRSLAQEGVTVEVGQSFAGVPFGVVPGVGPVPG